MQIFLSVSLVGIKLIHKWFVLIRKVKSATNVIKWDMMEEIAGFWYSIRSTLTKRFIAMFVVLRVIKTVSMEFGVIKRVSTMIKLVMYA